MLFTSPPVYRKSYFVIFALRLLNSIIIYKCMKKKREQYNIANIYKILIFIPLFFLPNKRISQNILNYLLHHSIKCFFIVKKVFSVNH